MEQDSLLLHQIITAQGAIGADVSVIRQDVSKAMIRLEVIEAGNKAADLLHADYETRLRLLERFRYTLLGIALVGGVLAGLLGALLGTHVH